MDDLYFEQELRRRERERVEKDLEDFRGYFGYGQRISDRTLTVLDGIDEILYDYYIRLHGENTPYEEVDAYIEAFKAKFKDDNIKEFSEQHEFTDAEKEFIKLVKATSTWRAYSSFNVREEYAITDIFLRKNIFEQFGPEGIEILKDIIRNEVPKVSKYKDMLIHYARLLSDRPFGEDIQEQIEAKVEEKTTYFFNQGINCGGYALKIDQCVFPPCDSNFSKTVSNILDTFPFVRLMGEQGLADDEYMVMYRAPRGKSTGHHFVRVDSDSVIREKDGPGEPRIFESWGELEDWPEAIFAVKKEHEMFGYDSYIKFSDHALDFEGSIRAAFDTNQREFSYHNHSFFLQKAEDDEMFVVTDGTRQVAEVMIDEQEIIVDILPDMEGYVENFSPGIKPIIKDGMLVNHDEFKSKAKEEQDIEEI